MKYLLLIYNNESAEPEYGTPESDAIMGEYFAFTQAVQTAGVMQAGEALHPVATATTVRIRDGKTVTVDGPFAETKEQLGGFYMIDVPTLDEALAWAAKIPSARTGSIEVRPIVDFGES